MGSQKISMIEGIKKIYSDVEFDYDEEVDVLYVSFGKPSKAISEDLGNGVILRYNEENDNIVGMTLIGIKKRSTH